MKYICILDTETTMPNRTNGGKIPQKGQKVFDIGIIIADVNGNVALEKQWLVKETFFTKLFYEEKRGLYFDRLNNPNYPTTLKSLKEILQEMDNIFKFYRVKEVYAYNMPFDQRVVKKIAHEYNLKNPLEDKKLECLWYWSTQTILQKKSFRDFADKHNLKSDKGNYKTSAETTYAYLIDQPNFVEEHTALEDCKIELEIYKACKSRHSIRARGMAGNPWVLVQPDEQLEKLPKQFRSIKVNLNADIEKAAKLIKALGKDLDVEVDVNITEGE